MQGDVRVEGSKLFYGDELIGDASTPEAAEKVAELARLFAKLPPESMRRVYAAIKAEGRKRRGDA